MRNVCVFCGSSAGTGDRYAGVAARVGANLAGAGLGVVFGGGGTGMMGALADGALAAGGRVIGIIPRALEQREVAHRGLTELRVVRTMHERKQAMAETADAFVMLPGGFGTFEEFCEVVTWAQLGMHRKPCVLVNALGYFDPMIAMFERGFTEGFIRADYRGIVVVADGADGLLAALQSYEAPQVERWLTGEQT
ncbi:MAG: TIGR00730 family Rossman fold protein [Betaproteobacteria bacterium]|jgi:hypothetical protein